MNLSGKVNAKLPNLDDKAKPTKKKDSRIMGILRLWDKNSKKIPVIR